jgi:hypothetical protein
MRWELTVGLVRWRRIGPKISESLSGGVGFVRWCRDGMWDETWDFLAWPTVVELSVAIANCVEERHHSDVPNLNP